MADFSFYSFEKSLFAFLKLNENKCSREMFVSASLKWILCNIYKTFSRNSEEA